MAWTALRTYVAGEILTAAILNTDHRDNVAVIKTNLDNSGNLSPTTSALTLASDACTPTLNRHTVDTQAAAATDDLSTLTIGGNIRDGHLLLLAAANTAHVVTVKNGVGNIALARGDFKLSTSARWLLLVLQSTTWREVARSADAMATRSVTALTTAVAGEFLLANGTFTVTLPDAAAADGEDITVKNIGTGTITIGRTGSNTIDGATTQTLPGQYDSMTFTSVGGNWYIR